MQTGDVYNETYFRQYASSAAVSAGPFTPVAVPTRVLAGPESVISVV